MATKQFIGFRLSPEDGQKIEAAAQAANVTVSEYCRQKALGTSSVNIADSITIEEHVDKLSKALNAQMQALTSAVQELAKNQVQVNQSIDKRLSKMEENMKLVAANSKQMVETNLKQGEDLMNSTQDIVDFLSQLGLVVSQQRKPTQQSKTPPIMSYLGKK